MKKLAIITILVFISGPLFAANSNGSSQENPGSGAMVEFFFGDLVTFLSIYLPWGGVIVREVGKK